jgi:hypothetical protein
METPLLPEKKMDRVVFCQEIEFWGHFIDGIFTFWGMGCEYQTGYGLNDWIY